MKILTYLEAHQLIEDTLKKHRLNDLSDKHRTRLIRLSGRLDLWLPPLTKLLCKNKRITNEQALESLKSLHLLEPVYDQIPPAEHLFLLPPATPPNNSWLIRHHYYSSNSLFSPLFTAWLRRKPILETHLLTSRPLTEAESKLVSCLFDHQNSVVSRDDLAQALWGEDWYSHYSDWTIDTNIHNLRKKLLPHWKLTTIRNRGYLLKSNLSQASKSLKHKSPSPLESAPGILPTKDYLNYMNNVYNPRRVYKDLFESLQAEKISLPKNIKDILAINSYSYDNVDALVNIYPSAETYFTGFDARALKLHERRIEELKLDNFHTLNDDIRDSRLKDQSFDLVINDFRLNWNLDHKQDLTAMSQMYRLLRDKGQLLLSVVVDARYESDKFGSNQQDAPLNLHKPWRFIAQEGLQRLCHTVPYYKKLISDSGFQLIKEFDIEGGKAWSQGDVMVDPKTRPCYRRFLVKKI